MHDFRPDHPGPIDGWPDAGFDAVLHLLDRQIVDSNGQLVGKVDDIELVEDPDGRLVPTALLVGMAALLPRFGAHAFRSWARLAPAFAERYQPGVVEIDLVDDVTSGVHLSVERDGLLRSRIDEVGHPVRHRLSTLLAMRVDLPPDAGAASHHARVLDVRLRSRAGASGVQVGALLVGRGRPGSMLGYERSPERGPWLIASVVRWLHRHSRLVEVGDGVEVDWDAGVVRVAAGAAVRPVVDRSADGPA